LKSSILITGLKGVVVQDCPRGPEKRPVVPMHRGFRSSLITLGHSLCEFCIGRVGISDAR
jgi:hypothetical protein